MFIQQIPNLINFWGNVISYTKSRFSISGGYGKLYQEIIHPVRLNKTLENNTVFIGLQLNTAFHCMCLIHAVPVIDNLSRLHRCAIVRDAG
jgi:hypothetical protein